MVAQTRSPSTKDQILRAARFVVQRDGVADLSIRAVAAEAGVNLALVHYHFHSRDGLLLAVLEDLDAGACSPASTTCTTDPTRRSPTTGARRVEYYRQDLQSGYVRVLFELAAHGYANCNGRTRADDHARLATADSRRCRAGPEALEHRRVDVYGTR